MNYVVRMDDDYETWDVLDNAPDEDHAYDLLEAYSNLYPYAHVSYLTEGEYNAYLSKLSH